MTKPARREFNPTNKVKPQHWILSIAAGIALITGAGIALPQLGNWMRTTVRLDDAERDIKDLKQFAREWQQNAKEFGSQISDIRSRFEKLESTVTDGNRRQEDNSREMLRQFAGVEASAKAMERTVATMNQIVNEAKVSSKNAEVIADQTREETRAALRGK